MEAEELTSLSTAEGAPLVTPHAKRLNSGKKQLISVKAREHSADAATEHSQNLPGGQDVSQCRVEGLASPALRRRPVSPSGQDLQLLS